MPLSDKEKRAAYQTEWRLKNKDRSNAATYRWREKNKEKFNQLTRENAKVRLSKDPRQQMLANSRIRAKKRGEPHTITKEDIVVPEFCPVLGLRLQVGQGVLSPESPSLDRRDPKLGYVPGNVWVISHRANSMKNDASPAELVRFAKAVLKEFDCED